MTYNSKITSHQYDYMYEENKFFSEVIIMCDNENFIDEWSKIRAKGKFKYILSYILYYIIGVSIVSIVLFLVFYIYQVFIEGIDSQVIFDIFASLDIWVIKKTLLNFLLLLIINIIFTYFEWNKKRKGIINY